MSSRTMKARCRRCRQRHLAGQVDRPEPLQRVPPVVLALLGLGGGITDALRELVLVQVGISPGKRLRVGGLFL
jgi:hypothetical protein